MGMFVLYIRCTYIPLLITFFIIECTISCQVGYVPNAACDECILSDKCAAESPCLNNGTCVSGVLPQDFSCYCTDYYIGDMCQSMKFLLNFAP